MRWKRIAVLMLGCGLLIRATPLSAWCVGEAAIEDKSADSSWTKTLPGGVTVELLGIAPHLGGLKSWFAPSGQPLPDAPLNAPNIAIPPEDETQVMEFAFQVKTPPEREAHYLWTFAPEGKFTTSTRNATTRKLAPDLLRITEELPRNLNTCSVRFGVAAGPWKTIFDAYGGGDSVRSGKPAIIFGKALDVMGKTRITIVYKDLEDDVRVLALDAGGEHAPSSTHAESVKGLGLLEVEFDLTPAKVQTFLFQTRPYQWVTFQDVALKPRKQSVPPTK